MELLYRSVVPSGCVHRLAWSGGNFLALSVSVQSKTVVAEAYKRQGFKKIVFTEIEALLWSNFSKLEGATKLKVHHSAPIQMCFCIVLFFAKSQNFQFQAENHGL